MSFIHFLFPPGEFDFPDHAWCGSALSTKTIKSEGSQGGLSKLEPRSKRTCTGRSHQRNSYGYPEHIAPWWTELRHPGKQPQVTREHGRSTRKNQEETSVPHSRGHRYSVAASYEPEAPTWGPTAESISQSTSSPESSNADWDFTSSPENSIDTPWTPGSACDQFRSGPFDHIFDGLRLTDRERDFLEELAQPTATRLLNRKQRAPTAAEIIRTLSQMTYLDFINQNSESDADSDRRQMSDSRPSLAEECGPVGNDEDGAKWKRDSCTRNKT